MPTFDRLPWCLATILAVSVGVHSLGQTSALPSFDAVSIHRGDEQRTSRLVFRPDTYEAIERPLWLTILTAYVPLGLQSEERIIGAPDWVMNDLYDFVGKVGSEDQAEWTRYLGDSSVRVPNDRLQALIQPMLQAALKDRLHLVVHQVPAQTRGYALVLARHGPNWKRMKLHARRETLPPYALPIADGGILVPIASNDDPELTFYNTSMAALAQHLPLGSPIRLVDRTGLTGKYDFKLTRITTHSDDPAEMWDVGALGLRLIPIRVPIQNIVIDHIERPTVN